MKISHDQISLEIYNQDWISLDCIRNWDYYKPCEIVTASDFRADAYNSGELRIPIRCEEDLSSLQYFRTGINERP